ncbi:MAG: Txe/YoeB family addiction module toxin [Azonexus sp.]|nr:Txe/YoeB family addiction module toxin [Azonexus sp.]MDP3636524.1 Txe/YoeB family addiction module toxin [Azonexus sp.]MDZ4317081.1 Txe/YoeB family addiction module toxin [Azonexus sp.]
MPIKFSDQAWDDYLFWQQADKTVVKRINALLKDIQCSPFDGLGKPEPLRHNLSGFWSRRIDEQHRLVYAIEDGSILVAQCRYHYQT